MERATNHREGENSLEKFNRESKKCDVSVVKGSGLP